MKAKRHEVGYYLSAQKYQKQILTRTAANSFRTYQQWFYFKTAADEGIISSSSKLEPLMIS
jgi:hypothetical protein